MSITVSGKALIVVVIVVIASLGGGAFGGYTYGQMVSKLEYQNTVSSVTQERDTANSRVNQLTTATNALLANNTLLKQTTTQLQQQNSQIQQQNSLLQTNNNLLTTQNSALKAENDQLKQQTSGTITQGQTLQIGYIASDTTNLETAKPYLEQIIAPDLTNYAKSLGYNINVQFLIDDAQGQANTHLEKIQGFHSMGINLVIGGGWSSQAQASLSYVNSNNMLLVSTSSTSPTLAIANDRLFRMCPADTALTPALVDVMWGYGIKSVIIFQRGDSWGDGIVNLFVPAWIAKGGEIAGDKVRYAAEATEFSNYLQVANTEAQAAITNYGSASKVGILLLSFNEAPVIISQAKDYPSFYSCTAFGGDGTALSIRIMDDAGVQAQHMKIFSLMAQPPNSAVFNSMKARYESLTRQQFSVYSADLYDAAWAIVQSVLVTGSTDASKVAVAFPNVCNSMNGISGPCKLNQYGDRDPPPFDIWYYASSTPANPGDGSGTSSFIAGSYYNDLKVTTWNTSLPGVTPGTP